ncbi:hypothetical protein ADK70_38530 [Streptomyces rimosus subsp. pseudoverticillatus]|uniref:phage portal protein n=1 Tax=Streptomyces rimosus TaxID=1927 RepID=UPI0006B26C69|nr:phage portal protein [Streptomyces rimosus]KOT76377.1 hypothetical protein ADK70_38530 [Streptomyces rimosus subsp. pseudoverticillatus]
MPRQFLPGLRRLLVPRSAAHLPMEEKSAAPIGNTYVSMTYAGTTTMWGTEGRAAGWDLDRVITEGYERSTWTFKAVEAISKHPGALTVEIGRGGDERGFAETLTDHPLLRVLNVQANPLERASVFKKRLSAQFPLSKKGVFAEITRSRGGAITRLDLLPPNRVEPVPDPHGDYLSHFEFTTYDGRVRELEPSRVVWLRDPHPANPFCGVTPLEAAGLSVDLDVKARTYNISFIDNDSRPSGIVGIDVDGLDQREMDRIQQRLAPGAQHAGETVVGGGPGGLNYEALSATAKVEQQAFASVRALAVGGKDRRAHHPPPALHTLRRPDLPPGSRQVAESGTFTDLMGPATAPDGRFRAMYALQRAQFAADPYPSRGEMTSGSTSAWRQRVGRATLRQVAGA